MSVSLSALGLRDTPSSGNRLAKINQPLIGSSQIIAGIFKYILAKIKNFPIKCK
jgi:hypothetical protein